jgi:MFS family permease
MTVINDHGDQRTLSASGIVQDMEIKWTTLKEAIGSAFKITSAIALLSGSGVLLMYCFQIRYWPVDLASLPGISGAIFVLSLFFLFLMFAPSVATYLLENARAVTKLFDSRRAFWSGVLITILQLLMGCTFAYFVLFFITSSSAKFWNGLWALICLLIALIVTRALIYWPQIRRDFDKVFRPWLAENRKMSPEAGSRRQHTRFKQFATVFGISSFGGFLAFLSLLAFVLRDVVYKLPAEPRTILITDVWTIALILALPLLISNLAVIFAVTRGPNSSLDRALSVLLFCMTYFIGMMLIIQFQFHGALLACAGIGDLRGCRLIVTGRSNLCPSNRGISGRETDSGKPAK